MTAMLWQEATFRAISPAALGGYVRSLNWKRGERFREYSDVYVGEGLPDIVVPRTQEVTDYGLVLSRLIHVFSEVTELDPQAVYSELVTADRDVIRVRVPDMGEGSLLVEQGLMLSNSARDLLLAAACSFEDQRPVFRVRSHQAAMEYIRRVRLGHTEPGSYTVTLLPPVVPPAIEPHGPEGYAVMEGEPLERRMTGHFSASVAATRRAAGDTVAGDSDAFIRAVSSGVSANFCEAMVGLIGPFPKLSLSVSWALTRPLDVGRSDYAFHQDDVPVLSAAAQSFRARGPKHDVRLFGKVGRLARGDSDEDGRITVRAMVDGSVQSVNAELSWSDYEKAIVAHQGRVVLGLEGDLERVGQRWHLRNPTVMDVISLDDPDEYD